MDATHREFVERLNLLADATDAQMVARFDALYGHTVAHFEQEAEWMRCLAFPPVHCHLAEHEGVLEVMREVRGHLQAGKFHVGRVLASEVAEWFRGHAATMDAMLAEYMRYKGFEPQARAADA
jgi:hemerythrin-like metal-binding protein